MATRTRVSVFLLPAVADKQAQERCIRSILNQSHRNLELLLPENTQVHAKTFRDSRIRTIALNSNADVPEILAQLSHIAEGSYIALADPAAWYQKHRLELQLRYFERFPETDLLGTSMKYGNELLHAPQISDVATMRFLLLFSPVLNHRTIMLRRRVAEQCSTMLHQNYTWDSLFLGVKNNLVIGLLPQITTFSDQSREADHRAFEVCSRELTEQFGPECPDIITELWADEPQQRGNGLIAAAAKAHALLHTYHQTGKPFGHALKKALATALMLRAQQKGIRHIPFQRNLFFWWRHSALDLKSKWRLTLL